MTADPFIELANEWLIAHYGDLTTSPHLWAVIQREKIRRIHGHDGPPFDEFLREEAAR